VAALLSRLDNDFQKLQTLLAAMLARRDQWLRHVAGAKDDPERARDALESALANLIRDTIGRAIALVPAGVGDELAALAARAAVDATALAARVEALLALRTLPIEELRGERLRRLDLRPLIYGLAVSTEDDRVVLEAHLALSQEQSARPTTLLAALGITAAPLELLRTAIEVETPRIALRAWRERGRFQ
jgi:hypothetical protein